MLFLSKIRKKLRFLCIFGDFHHKSQILKNDFFYFTFLENLVIPAKSSIIYTTFYSRFQMYRYFCHIVKNGFYLTFWYILIMSNPLNNVYFDFYFIYWRLFRSIKLHIFSLFITTSAILKKNIEIRGKNRFPDKIPPTKSPRPKSPRKKIKIKKLFFLASFFCSYVVSVCSSLRSR